MTNLQENMDIIVWVVLLLMLIFIVRIIINSFNEKASKSSTNKLHLFFVFIFGFFTEIFRVVFKPNKR